jgi:hypothetical protein
MRQDKPLRSSTSFSRSPDLRTRSIASPARIVRDAVANVVARELQHVGLASEAYLLTTEGPSRNTEEYSLKC